MKVRTAAKADSAFKDLLIVPDDAEEWGIMWNKVACHRLNRELIDPFSAEHYGEVWQYMETAKTFFGYTHRFRHRLHPKTGKRENLSIRASIGLKMEPNP